jgi:hypothetical protein
VIADANASPLPRFHSWDKRLKNAKKADWGECELVILEKMTRDDTGLEVA